MAIKTIQYVIYFQQKCVSTKFWIILSLML